MSNKKRDKRDFKVCKLTLLLILIWSQANCWSQANFKSTVNVDLPPPPADYEPYVNPQPKGGAPSCTAEQRVKIATQLNFKSKMNLDGVIPNTNGFGRGTGLSCPETGWLEAFYEDEANVGSEEFLGINVGCNKAFDAIRIARMGLSSREFDTLKWRDALLSVHQNWGNKLKSACRQPHSDQPNVVHPIRKGEVHCIEPMPSTFSAIQRASDELGLAQSGLVLANAAISTAAGTVRFPSGRKGPAGEEAVGIHQCATTYRTQECEDVPALTLDGYVDKNVKGKGPVNILLIDTEGWDFNILFGASSVLDRTHSLAFEYHSQGEWGKLHVQDAVRLLNGKGFTCYWAGSKNRLWRITECYFDFYDYWHGWSNVMCAHRSQERLVEKMENQFLQTIGRN